jgi:RHS repeat-associated protein
MALINNVSGAQFGALNSFINNSFNNIDLSKPQAFIVYMTFDKEMNLDLMNSGVIQVSHANTLGYLSRTAIAPQKDGFFYTYVTNRSAGKVLFDNMKITRWAPQVRVTYDYYPYGLTWEDPRLPGSPESIHDHCYQDKEFQWAEFTTGHGLALHDFHVTKRLVAAQRRLSDSNPAAQRCGARMYDGATGRWLVPDPAAQFANPYLAMGNNPVVGVDPDGQWVHILVGAVVGGVMNTIMHADQINDASDFFAAFGIGALSGAVGSATFGAGMIAGGAAVMQGSALVLTGTGGFISGAIAGGGSGVLSTSISGIGNNLYFGDEMPGFRDYAMSFALGGIMGGMSNGFTAKANGNSFWNGGAQNNYSSSYFTGKSYSGKTGYGNKTASNYIDESGMVKNPQFQI